MGLYVPHLHGLLCRCSGARASSAFVVPSAAVLPSALVSPSPLTKMSSDAVSVAEVEAKPVPISMQRGGEAPQSGGTATIPNEVFNLVKSIVGAGVLSLPAGIAAFGNAPSAIIPATFLISLMGLISAYTFQLIGRVSQATNTESYSDAWDESVGKKSSFIIAFSCFIDCFFGNLSYSMILADTLVNLLASVGVAVTRTQSLLGVTGIVLLPLCLMKNLASLAPFSLIGISGMLYTTYAMVMRYVSGAYAPNGAFLASALTAPSFGTAGASAALSPKALILTCMLSNAYIAHFNAPKYFRELKNNTMARFNQVIGWSFGAAITLYSTIAAVGFLTFGAASNGLILNNYSTQDLLMSLSRVAVAVSVTGSYPLLFDGTRDGLMDLFKIPKEKRDNALFNKMTFGILGFTTLVASKLTDLGLVASIGGATFGTALVFIYPTMMFLKVQQMQGKKNMETTLCKLIAGLGVVMGSIGTILAINDVGAPSAIDAPPPRFCHHIITELLTLPTPHCDCGGRRVGMKADQAGWQSTSLFLAPSQNGYGWGVFAGRDFAKGSIVEMAPLFLRIDLEDKRVPIVKETILNNYHYEYSSFDALTATCLDYSMISLGYTLYYNHSTCYQNIAHSKVGQEPDLEYLDNSAAVVYYALRDIREGEELLSNYGGPKWFSERGMIEVDNPPNPELLPPVSVRVESKSYCGYPADVFRRLSRTQERLTSYYPEEIDKLDLTSCLPYLCPHPTGYGHVIAKQDIAKGETVEYCPVLLIPRQLVDQYSLVQSLGFCSDDIEDSAGSFPSTVPLEHHFDVEGFKPPVCVLTPTNQVVWFPLAGNIGLYRRSPKGNTKLVAEQDPYHTNSYCLRVVATQWISIGDELVLGGMNPCSDEAQDAMYEELALTGQPVFLEEEDD
eukprot:Nitzschia sp. Nitz4//scaffold7_size249615//67219//72638//NITZ4_001156-RA/size249615-snap-gene-0.251-mRNA-1//-1//CDS//3329558379//5247//frame0